MALILLVIAGLSHAGSVMGDRVETEVDRHMQEDGREKAYTQTASWTSALLAVSGSVAAVKAPELAGKLLGMGVSIDLVVTEPAIRLLQVDYKGSQPWDQLQELARSHPPGMENLTSLQIHRDADEWLNYHTVGKDEVLHIELAKRNKLFLIAPLCANTLAAAATGFASNLLSSALRAWYYDLEQSKQDEMTKKYGAHAVNRPVLAAVAMNTYMWFQRVTQSHIAILRARGVTFVDPVKKKLACGDIGMGAMAAVDDIVNESIKLLRAHAAAEQQAVLSGKPKFNPWAS